MSLPVLRVSVYRDVEADIELCVVTDGAMLRGSLRPDDALRLARDLARFVGAAVLEQPKEVAHVEPV